MTIPRKSYRTKCISTKVTEAEYATLEHVAADETMSAWVRRVLLSAAKSRPLDLVLIAELVAVRMIVVNVLFALAAGEPPTAEAMLRLIERADREKFGKAQDRLSPGS